MDILARKHFWGARVERSPVVVEHAIIAQFTKLAVLIDSFLHIDPQLKHLQQKVAAIRYHPQSRLLHLPLAHCLCCSTAILLLCPEDRIGAHLSD